MYKVIFIMGVSGSGKSTIGEGLSARTGFEFYDADHFHTPENVAKMRAGTPLIDEDRWPWLDNLHAFIKQKIETNNIIIVCSALKQVYRDILGNGIEDNCKWIFLSGDYDTILSRLQSRKGHYMPATLLQSQFDALEIPANAITIDIQMTPGEIINDILSKISDVVE